MSPPCSLGTYQECEARNERTEHESSRSGDGGKFPVQPRRQDSIGDTFELEIIGDFRGEFVARQHWKQGDRRFVGNDAAVGRQDAVINDAVDVVLPKQSKKDSLGKKCVST